MSNYPEAKAFEWDSIILTAFRRGPEAEPLVIDITNIVVECSLFESLYLPYVSGKILIADSSAVSSVMNFQGQERITMSLTVQDKVLTKDFIVHNVSRQTKSVSDSSSTYLLELLEEHAYLSYFKKIRSAYSGNISEIIRQVFENELNTVVDIEESNQRIKALGVNRSPLAFSLWLRDRATSEFGEPMFLYSTLKEGMKMRSLGTLMNAAQNRPLSNTSFRYSQVPYGEIEDRFLHEASIIESIVIEDNNDMILIAREGALKTKYIHFDPLTGEHGTKDFNSIENFENRRENGRTLYDHTLFDDNFEIGGEKIQDLPSTFKSQINTTKMFGDDIKAYDEDDIDFQIFKVSRHSDMVLLDRERFDITIPGFHMLGHEGHTTIGTLIDIKVAKDQPATIDSSEDIILDKKRSGLFLITDVRHTFTIDAGYKASLSVARIATPDPINDPNREERVPR